MAGLVLKALGKAIADSGSMYAQMGMQDYNMRQAEERALRAEERAEERAIKTEERKEARTEAAALKDAEIASQAEANAPTIGSQRRFDKFKKDLGQTDMAEEDLRKVFDSQYDDRTVGKFEGADRYVEKYSRQKEDVLNEIRKLGGSSGLINQAKDVYKATLDAEDKEARRRLDERKEERKEEEFKALLPVKKQTADAATTRAARPTGGGSGGSGASGETLTLRGLQIASTTATRAVDAARKELESKVKAGGYTPESKAAIATAQAQLDAAKEKAKEVQSAISRFNSSRPGGGAAPSSGDSRSATRPPLSSFVR